ncbi:hypothetical protein Ddye_022789 [Dipteronia dyeriana]|uniref:Uncharacterized protein n=1 Tax=Dipteronia dyeriana TaxID=168575 RepID=A0AAD9WRS0_9ROSI|nr:hypothetical protein Ddye_022789 [Dipteronia dyeriana]
MVPMAIRCIKSICSSARSSWNIHSIAVAHRLGSVPVGETCVFIAVSAVHRADALDACNFLIDELNQLFQSGRRRFMLMEKFGRTAFAAEEKLR